MIVVPSTREVEDISWLVPVQSLQAIRSGLQSPHSFMCVFKVECIFTAPMAEPIDTHQCLGKNIVEHDVARPPAAQA